MDLRKVSKIGYGTGKQHDNYSLKPRGLRRTTSVMQNLASSPQGSQYEPVHSNRVLREQGFENKPHDGRKPVYTRIQQELYPDVGRW